MTRSQCQLDCPRHYRVRSSHCCVGCAGHWRAWYRANEDQVKDRWSDQYGFYVPEQGCALPLEERPLSCAEWDCHQQLWLLFIVRVKDEDMMMLEEKPLREVVDGDFTKMGRQLWRKYIQHGLSELQNREDVVGKEGGLVAQISWKGEWLSCSSPIPLADLTEEKLIEACEGIYRRMTQT